MATIRIRNLGVDTVVGTHANEQKSKQKVIINLEIEYDAESAIRGDDLKMAVDYERMAGEIEFELSQTKFQLVESVASVVLDRIMRDPLVLRATVRIDKPGALANADSVQVELTRP